ncbi:non-homologous end joining protein Ku [Hyalangium versicolor]|uniref:non-homologous end joining protein Ku n=1 Tax=Hyalangium versicolor TaxID=2861190 RepID=UPI001CCFAB04|nr:Ku protein [Hyalangium versicolor]
MSRPCWVGSLSFGLLHVPVRLYAAVEPKQVRFHLLHEADGARLRNKRVCSADGEEVPYEQVVKGYELRPGQYVEVTRGELEAFDPRSSRTIELEDFVELQEIDSVFFEAHYHLAPEVGAERQYALLVTALARSGRVGLGHLVLRHKGHLCMVRPRGRGLALSTLYYADEMISQDTLSELAVTGPRPSDQEVEMVLRLIESQSASFEPRRYHNTHRERLLAFLERRARAQAKVVEPAAAPTPPQSESAPERMQAFRRIEEGIAALRREGHRGVQAEGTASAQGSLRFRQQAARTVRSRPGEAVEEPQAGAGQGEHEPT